MRNTEFHADNTSASPAMMGGYNPMLAQLYRTHGVKQSSLEKASPSERETLCNDIVTLIEKTPRHIEREMATDILLSLLRQAEDTLKQAIAERLSLYDDAPLRLMLQFINDSLDTAKPVLRYSKALNDLDLLYIIQSRDAPFWQAIAERAHIGENVVEALLDTHDSTTHENVTRNDTAQFSEDAYRKLASLSEGNDTLSQIIFSRGENFSQHIYAYAGDALKAVIQSYAGEEKNKLASALHTLNDVLGEFTTEPHQNFMPSAAMMKAAELFDTQGKLNVILMLNTLKRGQVASFTAQFSQFVKLPVSVVIPMLQQKSGQALAIACRATAIQQHEFIVMYNYTRKISGEHFLTTAEMKNVLSYYNRLSPEVAQRLLRQKRN